MSAELLIADFDGFLVDSKTRRDEFFFYLCQKYGKPDPTEKIAEMSDGQPKFMDEEYNALGFNWEKNRNMIWKEFGWFFNKNPPELFEPVAEGLIRIKEKDDISVVLATMNSIKVIKPALAHYGLENLFDVIKTTEDIHVPGNHKGDLVLQILKEKRVCQCNTIMAGDQIYEAQIAKEYGMAPLAAAYGGFHRLELLLEHVRPENIVVTPNNFYSVAKRIIDKMN